MRYLSTFSGIEAATVAWEPLGWEPVAFAEIDPFACAVLAHRFPDVPNLGDVSKVDWSEYEGAVDLVVGGSPCQSFSIAGDRTGLEGASGLMWEWCRCVREVRPRWVVWENVPGCLSSGPKGTYGEDFRCLLRELDDMRFSVAWRVLDSQFFGVAQRRRRVFLCGASQDALGDAADVCAGLVLLEPGGLRRNRPKGGEAREAIASRAWGRAEGEGRHLMTQFGDELAGTLTVDWHAPAVAFVQNTRDEVRMFGGDGSLVGAVCSEPGAKQQCYVLKTRCGSDTYVKRDGTVGTAGKGALVGEEVAFTVAATQDQTLAVLGQTTARGAVDHDLCGTLNTMHEQPVVVRDPVIRRLTPVECERLQGFPDGWTDVPYRGREHPADGPRYKAIGNSMTTDVMRWIGERIGYVDALMR